MGPVTDSYIRALADRAMDLHRGPQRKSVPLAVHIVCDGIGSVKTQVHQHLKFRSRSKRQKDSVMAKVNKTATTKPPKVVKANAPRKTKTKVTEPKMVGLLGYQATYRGGTQIVVDKVMGWLKADGVTEVAIPMGHYPYVGGSVVDAAAAAGITVVLVAPNDTSHQGWRPETKLRLDALLKTGKASVKNLDLTGDPKDPMVYRAITRHIVHPAALAVAYAVILTNTPNTMGDVGIAVEEGCVLRPIRIRVLRAKIKALTAEVEAKVAAGLEGQSL
jgi:hypothetical protein